VKNSRKGHLVIVLLAVISIGPHALWAQEATTTAFLTWKPNQPEIWERLIEEFNAQNPETPVRVQVGPHSSTEYHAILTQRLKNQDPSVDVFFMDVIWPPEFANAGWALDLTSRFSSQEQKAFLSAPIAANTYQDRIYGVPCYIGAGLFYFRKDLLDKYNFGPPTSWAQMLAQGQTILKGEQDPGLFIYSGQFKQYEGLVCDMLEFIWSHGGVVLDPKTRNVRLGEQPAVQAVSFVRHEIIGRAAPRGAVNYEEPESLELFVQGRALFHRNWPYAWAVANDGKKSKVAGNIGVGMLPAFEGHSSASALGGWQFGISRWSQHPEAAWKFIRFMTSHESQKALALEAGLAPTRVAVYEDSQVQQKMPHLRHFLPAFQRARPRPLSPLYPMISQELQRFFSRAITDKDTDLEVLAGQTSQRIQRIVDMEALIRNDN
jgi:multiple sugar transport system substrate-binding protein